MTDLLLVAVLSLAAAQQPMPAKQPQIARARDRLARCLGLSIGGIVSIFANRGRRRVLGGV